MEKNKIVCIAVVCAIVFLASRSRGSSEGGRAARPAPRTLTRECCYCTNNKKVSSNKY